MMQAVQLPPRTLERLSELLRQRDVTTALIDTTITTAREALEVPDDWDIRDVRVGFVSPGVAGSAGQSNTPD
jgi:hypothetical protein